MTEKKTGKDRDQPETRDEVWSNERLKTFLALEPPEGMPADYNILLKAYRGMTADLFERFVEIYVEEGHDINVSYDGITFLQLLKQHRNSGEYAEALGKSGAK